MFSSLLKVILNSHRDNFREHIVSVWLTLAGNPTEGVNICLSDGTVNLAFKVSTSIPRFSIGRCAHSGFQHCFDESTAGFERTCFWRNWLFVFNCSLFSLRLVWSLIEVSQIYFSSSTSFFVQDRLVWALCESFFKSWNCFLFAISSSFLNFFVYEHSEHLVKYLVPKYSSPVLGTAEN